VDEGSLLLDPRELACLRQQLVVIPRESADSFSIPDYTVRFHRDASGRVTHLTLGATRVAGMRFSRSRDR
jgi:hypothetical protein